jgi:hypothetical protein
MTTIDLNADGRDPCAHGDLSGRMSQRIRWPGPFAAPEETDA